ncbi:hypothetical protein VTP01DRAFT_3621 [Rhizomucor pusillus]|uniref:uncharacterized protein n=1 Tax=Rhizomucor pusillus TaxID=4840 RepID=UPI0037436956
MGKRPQPSLKLLAEFFDMWDNWPWPEPVLLTDYIPDINDRKIEYESLEEFEDAVMPIVSPCYPVCSSAPYVTQSTLKVMKREFARAKTILSYSHTDNVDDDVLDKLFKKFNFLKSYIHFLRVTVTSETVKSNDTWIRKMAGAIPRLVRLLEDCPNLKFIHPFTEYSSVLCRYRTAEGKYALKTGALESELEENEYASSLEPGALHVTNYFIGLQVDVDQEDIDDAVVDLSGPIAAFLDHLESKRNSKDEDVTFAVHAANRRHVAATLDF